MQSPLINIKLLYKPLWQAFGTKLEKNDTCTHYLYINNVSTALIVLFYALIIDSSAIINYKRIMSIG